MTNMDDFLKNLGISSTFEQIYNRSIRAALLDRELYQEVEADTSLNKEALLIVILVSLASGIAAFVSPVIRGQLGRAVLGLIIPTAVGIGNYYLWAYVTQFIAFNMFDSDADIGELLRVLGYASVPRVLSLLGSIPYFGAVLSFVGGVWALVAGYIGIQEAIDLDTRNTLLTVFLGWLAIMVISGIVTNLLRVGATGFGL
jgi:hypothetical protein